MASLSNINGLFDVHSTGAILFSTSHGTSGQILKSNGNAAPTWIPQSDIVGDYLPLAGGTLTGATATASGISFTVGGALTGTSATFIGAAASGTALVMIENNSGSTATSYGLLVKGGGNSSSGKTFEVRDASGNTDLIVKGNGNVGIGTASPNKALTVYGGNDNGIWIDSQGAQYTSLAFGHNGTEKANIAWDNTNGYTNITTYGSGHLALSTGGGIKAFLNSSGNLGIGTTSPSSLLHLKKATLPRIALTKTGILDWFIGNPSQGTSNNFTIGTNSGSNTEILTITNTANVGIGTASPTYKLQVAGTTLISGGLKVIGPASYNTFQSANSYVLGLNDQNGTSQWWFNAYTNGNFAIHENLIGDKFTIKAGGNVGIGVTAPGEKLEVDGNAELKGNLIINKFSNTAPYADGEIRFTGRYDRYVGGIKTFTDNASYPEYANGLDFFVQRHVYALPNGHLAMRINSDGNVSIGTTNNGSKLNVGGPILASDNNQSAGMYVRRSLSLGHPGNTGTFTRTFNPVTQFGISRLGGNVLLEVSGWSQRLNCGYIYFQNAGGGGNITSVSYTQIAVSGNGSISVSVNSANDNSIDINFSNWHGNGHAWQAKIITQ